MVLSHRATLALSITSSDEIIFFLYNFSKYLYLLVSQLIKYSPILYNRAQQVYGNSYHEWKRKTM